jgi:site-specific recombinase XerD
MKSPTRIAGRNFVEHSDTFGRSYNGSSSTNLPHLVTQLALRTSDGSRSDQSDQNDVSSMSLAEFVRRRFVPEFVEIKKSAGRAHFHEMLKYILLSEKTHYAFAESSARTKAKHAVIQNWPYLDSLRVCEITEDTIRHIVSAALASGYSLQTATHIRNVIRAIYSYAISVCSYPGRNPAAFVTLPTISHKRAHSLTLSQVKDVMKAMQFPERAFALFALLTDLNLVEVSGLQWKCVNLSDNGQPVGSEWIPGKTIAVRSQWYRGEFRPVTGSRKRFVAVSDRLCSILRDLKRSNQFIRPQDFVLTSRSGTPVYPGNIAKRRLKSIGRSCEMPWLSWRVFYQTHSRLRFEFGSQLHEEYEKVLPLEL